MGTGLSGAEQSYQPFVGINHPIQPGDWHSTAPCSGLFVECLIRLVGRKMMSEMLCFKWPCGIFTYMSLVKNKPGCLGYIGDAMLPSCVGIIINHYKGKPDPRHPVIPPEVRYDWTPNTYPKHLLRRCLDVYGSTIFLILNSGKKNISQILHCFWFSQSFASQQKTRPTEPISVTRKHKNHTESLGGSFKNKYFHPEPWGRWTHFDSYFLGRLTQPPTRST